MIFKLGFIKATFSPFGWSRWISDRVSATSDSHAVAHCGPNYQRAQAGSGMLYGLLVSGDAGQDRRY